MNYWSSSFARSFWPLLATTRPGISRGWSGIHKPPLNLHLYTSESRRLRVVPSLHRRRDKTVTRPEMRRRLFYRPPASARHNSEYVRLSVCPSVCHTLLLCWNIWDDHWAIIATWYALLFHTTKTLAKFQSAHLQHGRQIRVGCANLTVINQYVAIISGKRYISANHWVGVIHLLHYIVQLCNSWQDFELYKASRGPSATVEPLVKFLGPS